MKNTPKRKCDFPDCGREHETKGLCMGHYTQARKGYQLRPLRRLMPDASITDKLAAYSEAEGSCRVWTGYRDNVGYGVVRWEGRIWKAHRVAYVVAYGPIPDGLVVNHICGNRACVTVAHLELVTQEANTQYRTRLNIDNSTGYRGVSFAKARSRYVAHVGAGGTKHCLGYFDTAEEAANAAAEGRARLHSMPEFDDRVVRAGHGLMLED